MIDAITFVLIFGIVLPVCLVVWAVTIPVLVFVYNAWKGSI